MRDESSMMWPKPVLPQLRGRSETIAAFYRIEAEIKGQSVDARLAARIERTKPKLANFEEWMTHCRAKVSAKSRPVKP